jgi:putative methyltransferase (TIGR04325 family)
MLNSYRKLFSTHKFNLKPSAQNTIWSGNYTSWQEAKENTTGYQENNILENCKKSLLKVKNGEAVYERDSVLFDKIQYSWGVLAGLQRAALENNGKLCVLDFGGSLGSTYYQNKEFLSTIKDLQWCIIEQTNFVDCGIKFFQNEQLKFLHSIEDCILKYNPNVLILSGVLQYLENPYEWIDKFILLKISYIILDRTGFAESEKDILTVQNVPQEIYEASYPAWFFNEKAMLEKFNNYSLIGTFESFCDPPQVINSNIKGKWSGHILRLKK